MYDQLVMQDGEPRTGRLPSKEEREQAQQARREESARKQQEWQQLAAGITWLPALGVAVRDGNVYQHGAGQHGMHPAPGGGRARRPRVDDAARPPCGAHAEVGGGRAGRRRSGGQIAADTAFSTVMLGPAGLLSLLSRKGFEIFAVVSFADGTVYDKAFDKESTDASLLIRAQGEAARFNALAASSQSWPCVRSCSSGQGFGTCQYVLVAEERLAGGYVGGAVRVGDTVRRPAGPWTPAVHALLAHLAGKGFTGAPRPLGFDERGREVLTFLEGETAGSRKPRPAWIHAEDTLDQVARWMRAYHQAVTDFVPPPGAVWRGGGTWSPGLIIAHNDAATYNAAWHQGKLTGFFDWDFAGPATREWDLALAAFSWVPLHARHVAAAEGFTGFAARPGRLGRFLRTYGWSATAGEFLDVVVARVRAHADGIRDLAASGDEAFGRLLRQGVPDALDQAIAELAGFPR